MRAGIGISGRRWRRACLGALAAVLLAGGIVPAGAVTCGRSDTVEIAQMKWPVAAFLAHLYALILERGYGCTVKLSEGEMKALATRLAAQGKPDILPALWTNSVGDVWRQAKANGRATEAGNVLPQGFSEGWWIPKFLADAHRDLRSVGDLKKFRELFKDPGEPGKGRLYSCPTVWLCATINRNLLRAYGLAGSFNLHPAASGRALDNAIAKASRERQPILAYHWAPAAVLGRYPMVALKMGPYNARGHRCNQNPKCRQPHPGGYPNSPVVTVAAVRFLNEAPAIARALRKIVIDRATVNRILAWQDETRAGPRLTAEHFLKTEGALWSRWVGARALRRIRASLN